MIELVGIARSPALSERAQRRHRVSLPPTEPADNLAYTADNKGGQDNPALNDGFVFGHKTVCSRPLGTLLDACHTRHCQLRAQGLGNANRGQGRFEVVAPLESS